MAVQTSNDSTTGMKPSLGLTGVTINAMALIAPGAFLWTTYQLQAAPGSAMSHHYPRPACRRDRSKRRNGRGRCIRRSIHR